MQDVQQHRTQKQQAALDYLNRMLKNNKPIGGQQLGDLIELVGESREESLLKRISPDILQLFPRLTCKTQSHFLQVFRKMSDYPSFTDLGKQLLNFMTDRGVRANAMCYTSLIKICTTSSDLDSALAMWELMKQRQVRPDAHVFASLLAACASQCNVEKAEELLKEMEQFEVEPNVYVYSALIDVYAKTTNISRAFATLDAMMQKDVRPNVWTFSTLINACARVQDLPSVFAIMRIMEQCEVRPNAHTYTTILDACLDQPQFYISAMELFERAKREKCINLALLTAVLGLAATQADLDVATSVMAIMKQNGWEPNERTYTSLLRVYSQAGKVDLAYETLLAMPKRGVTPNVIHLNVVLGACVKTCDQQKIIALAELIGRLDSPDLATYTSFMFLHFRLRRPDAVWATHQESIDNGFQPDVLVYQALLAVSWSKDDPGEMVEIFEDMKARGIEPDESICDTALAEVAQHVSSLPQDLHRPWKRILKWSLLDATCVHLLRAIASDEGARAAAEFISDLDDHHDLRPREASAATLLWLCALSHDRDGAQLVARAMAAGNGLDSHSVLSAFVGAMCQRGQPEAVLEVLEVLEEHAGAQAARPDLERLFGAAVSKGHLPTATRAFAALEALGTEEVPAADLARWRVALRSVEDEERLRAELAAEPHTHTPSRKYALFKSSLSDPLPPYP